MNTNISKINMNKIIVLVISFIVLVLLTMIINTFTKTQESKIANNKNEYSNSNKLSLVEVENSNTNIVQNESEQIEETQINKLPEVQAFTEKNNVNNETILYFENTEEEIDLLVEKNDEKTTTKIKEKFVELVDFVFYGTEINGITFDELTEETKQKIIDIIKRIDEKIEEKVPGYKESISTGAKESYNFLIDKLKQGINYADIKIEEKLGTEKYQEIKDNITETTEKVKESGSTVVEKGKEILGTAKEKIKNWYEGWK